MQEIAFDVFSTAVIVLLVQLSQAASIASLTNQVAELKDDLATALEQMSVQALISESRARQIEEGRIREEEQEHRITKLRSGVRVLWGMMQEMQMRTREQAESVSAGNEVARAAASSAFSTLLACCACAHGPPLRVRRAAQLLESLSELLSSERSKDKGADADQP